jgi:hypothetical protein
MPDFQVWDQTAHPIVRLENDWNQLLDHGLEGRGAYLIRQNGSYIEALSSSTGNITYGGADNAGSIDGTDASDVINAALNALASSGGAVYIKKGDYTITSQIVLPNSGYDIALMSDGATLSGDAALADHMIELDNSGGAGTDNFTYHISGLRLYPAAKNKLYYNIYIDTGHLFFIDNCDVGWNGIYVKDFSAVWIHDLRIVDTANEALLLDNVSYSFFDNIFCDNVGGYGDVGAYDGIKIYNGSHKLHFNNIHLYGQKGVGGGQAHGLTISVAGSSEFNNLYIEGFEDSSINIASSTHLSLSGLTLIGMDGGAIVMAPVYGDCNNIAISNFDITPAAGDYGITTYAQNTYDCKFITINNGIIHDSATGIGIYLQDDGGADVTQYVTVDNVIFETLNFGFAEKAATNSDYNQLNGGQMISVTNPVSLVGANTRVRNVMGYRNEHMGTATMLNATATIDVNPGFHSTIDFTATVPIVTLAGKHAEVLDVIWAVKDADEITITSQGAVTANRDISYYIAIPEAFRL